MEESDNRARILIGAEELFMRYGIRSISMDEIARHLGMSKKTLYQYFADKDDIVYTVTELYLVKERNEFENIREESKNSVDELVRISHCLRRNLKDMNPSLLFDIQKYHANAWKLWMNFKYEFIRESVVRNIKQGMEDGYFREDINPEIAARIRLETIQIGFDEQLFPKDKFELTEVQIHILEHFVYGLLTDKGRKLYKKYKETTQPTFNN